MDSEFSSNRHATPTNECEVPVRHPDLCFEDGNLAIVTRKQYFVVHRGLLCRHSNILAKQIAAMDTAGADTLEGRLAMPLEDDAQDIAHFLGALYGLTHDSAMKSFPVVSAILRLSTKYEVKHLRETSLEKLLRSWPAKLEDWDKREQAATSADGVYSPRSTLPYPLYVVLFSCVNTENDGWHSLIIKLGRETNAFEVLPSAFYDLSRNLPSQLMDGYTDADGVHHQLSDDDVGKVLRGKEHGARFFSTFIVTELEGRGRSPNCAHREEEHPAKRTCQMAFEAVTFELIRDLNGMVQNRNSDPLFTIADSVAMQTRDDQPGVENKTTFRACEACRLEYATVVKAARETFWRQLPIWFEVGLKQWG
ncbi:hypothetical protein C8Q70DRAFT_1057159 [Cubamyces menziesii]|nr:hypothetical protein C8Q70DRAFT_1057159 [Cubamyces menziesii]